MSRLIDADELENMTFSQGYNHDGVVYVPLLEVRQNIIKAKTAYDVDKVVAELEEFEDEAKQFGVSGMVADMIDVVRKGGVE